MFPIMDVNNRVIGFGGRVMGEGEPKYLNSPETAVFDKSRNLYGLNKARTSRKHYFLLCEGYMDVIALHQAGFTNAVASLGTAFTSGHGSLIKRYVNEVYLTFDSDEAGTKAALRALPILREAGITGKIIRMDPYKDPDEFIKNLGAEAFEERINQAKNGFMFSIEVLERAYDIYSPEGKTGFLNEVAKRLTEFEDTLERNNYIEAVANKYRIKFEDLQQKVAKVAIKEGMAKPASKPKQTIAKEKLDGNLQSQKILLTWLIENEKIFAQIKKYISPQDFTGDLYKKVAELLYEQYEQGEINPAKIMNHFMNEEEHREVGTLFHSKIAQLTTRDEQEKALKETIIRVKTHSVETATSMLDPTDFVGLQRLMEAKRNLQDLQKLHISIE
jgi:DNA primase